MLGVVVDGALVVTVTVVGGVVALVPDDESAGFQMLKNQNDGSVIGADSGPIIINLIVSIINHSFHSPQNSVPLATPELE